MIGWLGSVLFAIATIIAVLIAVWVLWEFVYETERGRPIIQYHALFAAVIWLGGWVSRQMRAGPGDDSPTNSAGRLVRRSACNSHRNGF